MITAADPQSLPAGPGYLLIAGLACTAAGAVCFLGFLITATCDLIRHHREGRILVPLPRHARAATAGALLLAAAGIVSGLRHLYWPTVLFGLGVLVLTEAALRERRRARRAADDAFAASLPQRLHDSASDLTRHLHTGGTPDEIRLECER
ncbi:MULTISPECIES: hypothetical protein [Streptomyces]|uniref:hypothetical protein n=1 Tax=Streptomyces TaxID=1883 RepID=UPI00073DD024|nr:hypothetical protein [Streptomyces sp. FBKL.4005]MYU28626.1 hypothetical protein [Streptomyces sp. SID7810]OYP17026.1 hypothetical protein CFC35_23040 [Streptomyces sp. FBKL.4005]CUW29665.1 hypothetical protein TUE45_04374 [Streptomyces reticuli]